MTLAKLRLPTGALLASLNWAEVDKLSQRYLLGEPAIDTQHRILFAWCVALATTPEVRMVLRGLRGYAAGHFKAEEAWAASHGIDVAGHHQLHADLVERLDALLELPDPAASRLQVQALLYDWLTDHIDNEDRALLAHARA